MPQEKVEIEIDIASSVMKIECNGFVGEGCNAIEEIENAISSSIIDREDKEEKYQYHNINPAQLGTFS